MSHDSYKLLKHAQTCTVNDDGERKKNKPMLFIQTNVYGRGNQQVFTLLRSVFWIFHFWCSKLAHTHTHTHNFNDCACCGAAAHAHTLRACERV